MRRPTPVLVTAAAFGTMLTASLGYFDLTGAETRHGGNRTGTETGENSHPTRTPEDILRPPGFRPPGSPDPTQPPMIPTPGPSERSTDEDEDDGPFSGVKKALKHLLGDKDETPSPKPSESKKPGLIRKQLNRVVPGLKDLPDWALPIVAKAEERKAPGTVVRAHMDAKGRAVISGEVVVEQNTKNDKITLISFEQPVLIGITAVIEDPTKATPEDPATVKVIVTNPETHEKVAASAEITAPEEVAKVTEELTVETVESTQSAEVMAEAEPFEVIPQESPEPTPEPLPTVEEQTAGT